MSKTAPGAHGRDHVSWEWQNRRRFVTRPLRLACLTACIFSARAALAQPESPPEGEDPPSDGQHIAEGPNEDLSDDAPSAQRSTSDEPADGSENQNNNDAPSASPAIVPPSVAQFVEAAYPPTAEQEGREARVLLSVTVGDDGSVREASVLQPVGDGFDEAALEAVRRFLFHPATRDGVPFAARIQYEYVFELAAAEPAFGALAGRVLGRGTDIPIAFATVTVLGHEDTSPQVETTDEDGAFSFSELPPGTYAVRIDAADFEALEVEEEVRVGEESGLTYRLQGRVDEALLDDEEAVFGAEAVIEAPAREVTRRTITREALTRIPGTRGDALRAIEVLPGVGRPAFGGGELLIRGSDTSDSQAFIEGAPLPLLYHFGGLTSTINSRLIDQIAFVPGNFSVRYGRKMGGIIEVDLRDPSRDGVRGVVELGAIDASAMIEVPLNDRTSLAVGARRSTLDLYFQQLLPDDVGLVAAPVYYDYQAMLSYRPTSRDRIRFMFYGANDRFALNFDDAVGEEPAVRGAASLTTRYNQLQFGWRREFSPRTSLDVDVLAALWQTDVTLGTAFDLHLDIWHSTHRVELRHRFSDRVALTAGLDIDVDPFRVRYTGPPLSQYEGQITEPDSGDDPVAARTTALGFRPAAYLEADLYPVERWQVVLGARVDYNHQTRNAAFDPRLTSVVHLTDGFRLKGGVGLFSQPAEFEMASESAGGNADLRWQHALHTGAGFEWDIADGVRVGAEGFYKYLWDRVVSTPGGEGPGFDNAGVGRIYGMELSARVNPGSHNFFGYLSYTLSRSERRDRPESQWRLFDYDQTHIFTLTGNYRLPRGWQVGATIRLVSGNPVTDPSGAVLDVDNLRYLPVSSTINGQRSALFNRLDLRVEKIWTFDAWRLAFFLDVQNVTNRRNEEGRSYNYDWSESEPIRGLPILPAIGIRGEI